MLRGPKVIITGMPIQKGFELSFNSVIEDLAVINGQQPLWEQ